MTIEKKESSSIGVEIGSVKFSGTGNQQWLSEQLEKVLQAAQTQALQKVAAPSSGSPDHGSSQRADELQGVSLATFLRSKNAEKSQNRRFLATAVWLRSRTSEAMTTSLVAKALADNHQSRLGNPSECLNQNVAKGYCEKLREGGFFVTPEGLSELG